MKTFKTPNLSDEFSEMLEALTAAPVASKTSTLTNALTVWLERKAGLELDQRFGPWLERQAGERKVDALTEMLGLLIKHQMTLVAHQPGFDPEKAQLGHTRL